MAEFRDELHRILGKNLKGLYLHGSIAFPDYEPRTGDIDFYAIVQRSLTDDEITRLDRVHRNLAEKFEPGKRLDGFYVPIENAGRTVIPRGLVSASHSRIHRGGSDEAWALHLEHFHGLSYIRLQGPKPTSIFPTPDWQSLRTGLYRELAYARSIIDTDTWWAILNLCRLIYSFKNGRVVISKLQAGKWALRELPAEWRPLVGSALRTYHQTATARDRTLLKRGARKFLGFASVRVIAYDTIWNKRQPHIAHLRKSARVVRN